MSEFAKQLRHNERKRRWQARRDAMITDLPRVLAVYIGSFVAMLFILGAFHYSMDISDRLILSFGILFLFYPLLADKDVR